MFIPQFTRPTSTQGRVHPSILQDHRMSNRMLGPCCLCPMTDASKPDFIKSAIYVASGGDWEGQYVATCAKDLCGYCGMPPCASHTLTGSSPPSSAFGKALRPARSRQVV